MVKIADFIEAPNSGGNYTKVLLVVHDTEGPESLGAARDVVAYWNRVRTGSTQYVVDSREIIQAVRETAYAWAAGTTANIWGIHVEHVGYASQTRKQWNDAYSSAELALSAPLFAELGHKYGIPLRRLTVDQIRHAVKTGNPADGGICSHADISKAFPKDTSHTDPGPNFPWDHFMALVTEHGEREETKRIKPVRQTRVTRARSRFRTGLHVLTAAVRHGRKGRVRKARDRIRHIVNHVLPKR